MERLYRIGSYSTPWLRSVVKVLEDSYMITGGNIEMVCSPTGGGKKRGAHNCGSCDKEYLKALEDFNLSQDPSALEVDRQCCRDDWSEHLIYSRIDPMAAEMNDPRSNI